VRTRYIAGFAFVTTALAGCSDDTTAPKAPNRPSLAIGTAQEPSRITHAPIRQRFGAITIDARTRIKVGSPVQIEVDAPVIIPSSSAHLKVQLPEVAEIAFRQKYGARRSGPMAPGSHLDWKGEAARGNLRQSIRVTFPVPGLYRVSAHVVTDDPSVDEVGDIQNAAGTVSWIFVTKTGGRVIHSFSELVNDREATQTQTPVDTYVAAPEAAVGTASVPQIICPYSVGLVSGAAVACSPCDVDPSSCVPDPSPQPGTFSGTLLYENQRLGTIGLAGATMSIMEDRVGGWSAYTFTADDGKFTLPCPPANLRGQLQMSAAANNPNARVIDVHDSTRPKEDLSYYRAEANAAIDKCGTDTGPYRAGKPHQAELLDNITRTALKSRATFPGFSRPKIQVQLFSGTTDAASGYDPVGDTIIIYEPRSIGEVGLFEAGHEYGHALHQVAMGPIFISGTECQTHDFGSLTTYRCAFVEGFAHYHSIAVWGTQVGAARYNGFDRGEFVGLPSGLGSSQVGPQTEGAVASTMLHFGDGTGTRYVTSRIMGTKSYPDGVSAGHGQIAAAIRDCRIILSDGSSQRVDGVDYLAYCFEKAVKLVGGGTSCNKWGVCTPLPAYPMPVVDPIARDNFFGGLRGSVPRLAVPYATGWSWGTPPVRTGYDTAVRTVWACNLFWCQ